MIAILLAGFIGSASSLEPDNLPAEERRSTRIIKQCEDLNCRWDRNELGRAFLVRAAAAAVLRGQVDERAAANARLLVPDEAALWEGLLATDTDSPPDPWVRDWLVARELAHGDLELDPPPPVPTEPERDLSEHAIDHLSTPFTKLGQPESLPDAYVGADGCAVRDQIGVYSVRVVGRKVYGHTASDMWVAVLGIREHRYMIFADPRIEIRVGSPDFSFRSGMFARRHRGKIREGRRIKIGWPVFGHSYRYSDACSNSQAALGAIAVWHRQRISQLWSTPGRSTKDYSRPAAAWGFLRR
ncbi:MAG: hypothetical protein AB8H79_06935 [Myxococcota bacterium]